MNLVLLILSKKHVYDILRSQLDLTKEHNNFIMYILLDIVSK